MTKENDMAKGIQFRGIEDVVKAYEMGGVGPWAIIIAKGQPPLQASDGISVDDVEGGAAQLREFLHILSKGGSESRYDLHTYKLPSGETEIDAKSTAYRGFTFSLWGVGEESPYRSRDTGYTSLREEIEELRGIVRELCDSEREKESDSKEEAGIMGMISGIIADPQVKQMIGAVAARFVNNLFNMNGTAQQPARVAGAEQPPAQQLSAEQIAKVNQALPLLASRDAQLGDHLLKLAQMPEATYQMALKFL